MGNRYQTSNKVISIIGESRDGVVVTWNDYHGKTISYPDKGSVQADGTTAPTMTVTAPDFYMENVTVRNTVTDGTAQAEALYQAGDRQVLKNVRLDGYQDTHRTKKGNRYFYYGCEVKGNVDFIYGGGTCYFYRCNLVGRARNGGKSGGYITAPEDVTYKGTLSNGKPLYYEFFFNDCDITSDGNSDFYLARPWADKDCGTVFLNTRMCSQVNKAGWSGSGNNTNMSFAEYNSMNADGTPYDTSKRVAWGIRMTDADYYLVGMNTIYEAINEKADFNPIPAIVGVAPSATKTITKSGNSLNWEMVPGARGFIIYLNGEIIDYTEGNTYYDAQGRTGTFQVRAIAENGALSPLNGEAYDLNAAAISQMLNPVPEVPIVKKDVVITAKAQPEEYGSVEPDRIECKEGDIVTFTAKVNDGYIFNKWTNASGDVLSVSTQYTFTATDDLELIANFTKSEISGEVDDSYQSATWNGSSVVRAEEFAAVTDAATQNATNEENGRSVIVIERENMTVTAVGGTTPAANPADVFNGKGEQIDGDGNVAEWKPVQWKTGKQDDIQWYYIEGTGNPYVTIYAQHFSSDYPDAWRAAYTYYEPDGSNGMPIAGLYYQFQPKVSGTLRVKVWVKKDRRRTFVVDEATQLPIAYRKEGYINGQNDASGKKRYLTDEEITSLHDAALGQDNEPWVIGHGNSHFWGWLIFEVEAGKSYWAFMQNSQLGFGGYDFLYGGTDTGIVEHNAHHSEFIIYNSNAVYNLAGQSLSRPQKGVNIQNGKKIVVQ